MDKKSNCNSQDVSNSLERICAADYVPAKYQKILRSCYEAMRNTLLSAKQPTDLFDCQFIHFIQLVEEQFKTPFIFPSYHQKIRAPIDYYRFGLDFIRPLIDSSQSKVFHLSVATEIEKLLRKGENVILLANHQTEVDPQAIAILLEKTHPLLAENIIYLAGERVTTDPLAIPFSLGCDLLCIYSKKYIDQPPELKTKKQLHNKHTMAYMSHLLKEGGKIFYVAPSGGRDRRNRKGQVEVAFFDPQSIEMMHIMAKKGGTPTHFYPLTLITYDLLPPPETVQVELGEMRDAKYTPIYLSFGEEFFIEEQTYLDKINKERIRKERAERLWNIVNRAYIEMSSKVGT